MTTKVENNMITYSIRLQNSKGLRVLTVVRAPSAGEAVAKVCEEFADHGPLETVVVGRWAPAEHPVEPSPEA